MIRTIGHTRTAHQTTRTAGDSDEGADDERQHGMQPLGCGDRRDSRHDQGGDDERRASTASRVTVNLGLNDRHRAVMTGETGSRLDLAIAESSQDCWVDCR